MSTTDLGSLPFPEQPAGEPDCSPRAGNSPHVRCRLIADWSTGSLSGLRSAPVPGLSCGADDA